MIDLTAAIETINDRYRTHMDLYYPGATASYDTLITDCVLLDISGSPEQVPLQDLAGLRLVEQGNSVLLVTGWERHRDTPIYDQSPSIDRRLIEHLINLQVSLVLVDSPGVYGGAAGAEHNAMDQYLADHKAYAVENVVNAGLIRKAKFKLYCFPIHASASNAAPCRILADA